MEVLSGSEFLLHLISISPLAEQGWEGMPDDYNLHLQVRPWGSYPDLQVHLMGLEPNFSGFRCEHLSPCSHDAPCD